MEAQFYELCELLVFHVCLPQSLNLAYTTVDKLPLGDRLNHVFKARLREQRNRVAGYVEAVNGRELLQFKGEQNLEKESKCCEQT